MSHFTTAVSLSGVAKTWSRSTLQSFQDLWKYPLHVFSCMYAWVGVLGFYTIIPSIWMQLIIDDCWYEMKNHLFVIFPPSQECYTVHTFDWSQHKNLCRYDDMFWFAEHYQWWNVFIRVESDRNNCKAQIGAAAMLVCLWDLWHSGGLW